MIQFKDLPNTDTPINSNNLNANFTELNNIKPNAIQTIMMKGTLTSGKSFNDVLRSGESSCYLVNQNQGTTSLPGYPKGAYEYGMLLTLSPTNTNDFSAVQIYIPDWSLTAKMYVRTGGNPNSWSKIAGTEVAAIS